MKKLKRVRKFSRETDQRKALLRGLANSLFLRGKITTTESKAKELSSFSQKLITCAKKGGLPSRRIMAKYFSKKISKKIVDDIAPKYKDRKGGYVRITKLGPRKSDSARMAIIELI